MDQEAQAAERRLALEARDEVIGQLHPLERLAEDELARVEDEWLVGLDVQELREVGLRSADVDVRVAVVAKDPESPVEVQIDRGWLEVVRVVRVDPHAPRLERRPDVAVGQDAHPRDRFESFGRMSMTIGSPRSA